MIYWFICLLFALWYAYSLWFTSNALWEIYISARKPLSKPVTLFYLWQKCSYWSKLFLSSYYIFLEKKLLNSIWISLLIHEKIESLRNSADNDKIMLSKEQITLCFLQFMLRLFHCLGLYCFKSWDNQFSFLWRKSTVLISLLNI